MPNTIVRANGEAMPIISRRRLLAGGAAIPVCGLAAIVPAAAMAVAEHDPLLDVINTYRKGLADFNAFAHLDDDEATDAYAEVSYMPPMMRLMEWDEPARTKQGAIEALRFAVSETTMFEASPMVLPLLTAALAYFDAEAI